MRMCFLAAQGESISVVDKVDKHGNIVQEKQKKQMFEKFREAEMRRLQDVVASGRVEGAEKLVSSAVNTLQAKLEHAELQRDTAKVRTLENLHPL